MMHPDRTTTEPEAPGIRGDARSSPNPDGRDHPGAWLEAHAALIVAGLLLVGLALRFFRLGEWNLEATEIFTLRDSVTPQWRNPRPLGYLLNYYLVRPFRPLDEFGLRLVPAIGAVVALPAFYFIARRLIGIRAALFGTLLLTVSALHVFYAQFARYWSLVFLFSAIYPYALYLGARDRSRGMIAVGVATMVLAVLAHPVAILAIGGPVLWALATYARPHYLRRAWQQRWFRWTTAVLVVLLVVLAFRLVPMLYGWISMHDRNPGMGQFLLPPKPPHGIKQMLLLLAYVEGLTIPVALAALGGVLVLWQVRDRTLAVFLASLAGFQLGFIALISVRTPVSTFYLLPAAPVFFLGAGVFLDHMFRLDWRVRPRWLLPATITLALLVAGMPTLVSQYRNGRRFDFRSMAKWLEPRLSAGDIVYSDQPMVLAHYLGGIEVQKLRHNPAALQEARSTLQGGGSEGTLWVVAPAPSHAFRTDLRPGGLARWLYDSCQLNNTTGRGRLDFRQQYLHLFRCPPAPAPTSAGAGTVPARPAG